MSFIAAPHFRGQEPRAKRGVGKGVQFYPRGGIVNNTRIGFEGVVGRIAVVLDWGIPPCTHRQPADRLVGMTLAKVGAAAAHRKPQVYEPDLILRRRFYDNRPVSGRLNERSECDGDIPKHGFSW
jgi:hypothetical protein